MIQPLKWAAKAPRRQEDQVKSKLAAEAKKNQTVSVIFFRFSLRPLRLIPVCSSWRAWRLGG